MSASMTRCACGHTMSEHTRRCGACSCEVFREGEWKPEPNATGWEYRDVGKHVREHRPIPSTPSGGGPR